MRLRRRLLPLWNLLRPADSIPWRGADPRAELGLGPRWDAVDAFLSGFCRCLVGFAAMYGAILLARAWWTGAIERLVAR